MLRIFFATLLSALWPPLYTAFFANLLFPELSGVQADLSLLYKASINWSIGFVYGFIPMIVLTPLADMVLRWRKHNSLLTYITVWFLLSQTLWWGYLNLAPVQDDVVGALIRSLLFNLAWIPAGATFWAITRPDLRDRQSGEAAASLKTIDSIATTPPRQRSQFGMRGRMP